MWPKIEIYVCDILPAFLVALGLEAVVFGLGLAFFALGAPQSLPSDKWSLDSSGRVQNQQNDPLLMGYIFSKTSGC